MNDFRATADSLSPLGSGSIAGRDPYATQSAPMPVAAQHIASNLAENEARLHELLGRMRDLKTRAFGDDPKVANAPATPIRGPKFSGMIGELDGLSCRIGDAIDQLEHTLRTLETIA